MGASQQGIKAGRAYVELGVSSKLQAGLKRAQRRLRAFGAGVQRLGRQFTLMGAAMLASLAGAAKHFASYGDQLAKMSKRTGVSVEALSALRFAAARTGALCFAPRFGSSSFLR